MTIQRSNTEINPSSSPYIIQMFNPSFIFILFSTPHHKDENVSHLQSHHRYPHPLSLSSHRLRKSNQEAMRPNVWSSTYSGARWAILTMALRTSWRNATSRSANAVARTKSIDLQLIVPAVLRYPVHGRERPKDLRMAT